jgi:hypothetical protein
MVLGMYHPFKSPVDVWGLKFQVSSLLCFCKGTYECELFTEMQGTCSQ